MPTLQLTDAEIYYEVHGHGQAIVFLSETACDGEVWKIHQVPEFSKDHRVKSPRVIKTAVPSMFLLSCPTDSEQLFAADKSEFLTVLC